MTATEAEGLKFTDKYEVTVPEKPANDADVMMQTTTSSPSPTAQCVENDGTTIEEDIMYSLVEGDPELFSVDSDTGEFSVSGDHLFDYEKQTWFNVTIRCHLTSDPSQFGNGIVNISVGSVNEYNPTLSIDRPILVAETTARGTVIAAPDGASGALGTYTANDRDNGPDGVIIYSFDITNGNDRLFEVNHETGTITLDSDLDRDVDDVLDGGISVFITACNIGLDLDTCPRRQLTIYITPINDIVPEFTEPIYTGSLNESAPNGTVVVQVICLDGDKQVGGVQYIAYGSEVSNVTSSIFEVEYDELTTSANITLKGELDYETTTSYTFSLVCSDGFEITTTQVRVDVLPVNDNKPQFEKENYEFPVNRAESNPSDTIIGRVAASDADSGEGGRVTYSLSSDKFSIDSETGEITLKDYLSAGDGSTFDFDVIASDGEYETRAGVRVTVDGLLSFLEWVYVGIGGFVLLVIVVIIGIIVFHHFIKAASIKTVVKEKYIE